MTRDEMITAIHGYCDSHEAELAIYYWPGPSWQVEITHTQQPEEGGTLEEQSESLEEALSVLIVRLRLLPAPSAAPLVVIPEPLETKEAFETGTYRLHPTELKPEYIPMPGDELSVKKQRMLDKLLIDMYGPAEDWDLEKPMHVSLHTASPPPDPPSESYPAPITKENKVIESGKADSGYEESNLPPHMREAIAKLEQEGGIEQASQPAPGARVGGTPGGGVFKESDFGV